MEAERINLMPIQSDDLSYVYKSFRDLPDNYWKLATTRISNGINCGINNPNSFLRQYDFSNERYQYILRADRSSEINAMVTWQLTNLPNSPMWVAVAMQTDNYTQFLTTNLISQVNNKTASETPFPLSQSYATCQGTRNEMAIKQITAKQAIENNPSSNDSNELRLRYIQIICPYLLKR